MIGLFHVYPNHRGLAVGLAGQACLAAATSLTLFVIGPVSEGSAVQGEGATAGQRVEHSRESGCLALCPLCYYLPIALALLQLQSHISWRTAFRSRWPAANNLRPLCTSAACPCQPAAALAACVQYTSGIYPNPTLF